MTLSNKSSHVNTGYILTKSQMSDILCYAIDNFDNLV